MIGVLALQGDYEKHIRILEEINISSVEIKYPDQLKNIDGLIIPGGESTTMSDLMTRINFQEYLIKFSQEKPIMGTCAGLIMMSKTIQN
ncbi:MAG: pyridoxal 5'-phosphate synthase glutaminase subunit PdxT, partial [Candidatus Neomarinimicrobiota bacterium]|nr:pyridoxal 5'-phosphate synthase glutaminase subunit PdxT [Candidatus Neomarinimicrobiota bacterium]